ncbi:glycoside hydrolase family 127 protein, partial [Lentilactobacillus hilgardii]|nr:glycoside hydrolase family 127 protein [Lentilactobacillus hilgardii]
QAPLWLYQVSPDAQTDYHFDEKLLDGVGVIKVAAKREKLNADDADLYTEAKPADTETVNLTMVPYYAWANRQDGQMRVWLNK